AVQRIDYDRRAKITDEAVLPAREAELREVVMDVGDGAGLGLLEAARDALLDDLIELVVRIERFVAQRLRTLDGGERRIRPEALQIGMPVRCARNVILLLR